MVPKARVLNAQKTVSYSPVHPTFLYESLWCLASFLVILFIYKKCRRFSGQLFLTYGLLYGTGRAIIEGFRTDSLYIGSTSLRVSQLLSIVVAAIFLVLLITLTLKYKKNPRPIEGVDYFPADVVKTKKSKNGKASKTDMQTLAQKRAERMIKEEKQEDTINE